MPEELKSKARGASKGWVLSAIEQQEIAALSRVLNHLLGSDPDLTAPAAAAGSSAEAPVLPIDPRSTDLLWKVRDGLLLAKVNTNSTHASILSSLRVA